MITLRRTMAATAAVACAASLAACGSDSTPSRQSGGASATPSSSAGPAIPSADQLTQILDQASDPNTPTAQKVNLVQGGADAPDLFDQIAKIKQQNGATISITDASEGDSPDTAIANAVIKQPGQQDINVQAQFIDVNGQWQLAKSFACALVTNSGLQAPATCAGATTPAP